MKKHERRSPLHGRCALWIAVGCAALAPLGCSSESCADSADTCTTGTGGNGGAGTGGVGGTGGLGGAAGSGGSGGDPVSDASGPICGGFASLPCPEPTTSFCDYEDKAMCGMGDISGICTPRPDICTDDCPGVCGCDGKFYCNMCMAQRAGVDALPTGTGSCSDAGTLR